MDLEAVRLSTNFARASGLTLLEILVVIGILAILLSIGFPQYAAYQRGLVMRDVSNQIAQLLRETAAQAKAETTEFKVDFLLNQSEGIDIRVSSSINGIPKSSTIKLERDASITSIDGGVTSVVFNVRGRPNNTNPIVIHAAYGDTSSRIRLLTTGKTVIQ